MHQFISETAKYGDLTRGPRIVNERVKNEMRKVLKEVQSGKFARQWIRENAQGRVNYQRLLKPGRRSPDRKVRRGTAGPHAVAAGSEVTHGRKSRSSADLRHHAARRGAVPPAAA